MLLPLCGVKAGEYFILLLVNYREALIKQCFLVVCSCISELKCGLVLISVAKKYEDKYSPKKAFSMTKVVRSYNVSLMR